MLLGFCAFDGFELERAGELASYKMHDARQGFLVWLVTLRYFEAEAGVGGAKLGSSQMQTDGICQNTQR